MSSITLDSYAHVTPRQFGLQIAESLEARRNINIVRIADNEALTVEQRHRLIAARLLEAALTEIDQMQVDEGLAIDTAENATLLARLSEGAEVGLEPNFVMTQHNANIVKEYRGQQLKDFVFTLTKRFENMSNAKSVGQLAIEITSGSLVSVGISMASLTIQAWRAGGVTLLQAVRTGITGIGLKTAVTVVIFVLAALLLYLLLENPKKILGMLINDTDEDVVVNNWRAGVDGATGSDLYMAHGHMESFPEDHATGDLDSPLIQLRKRYYFGPSDPENSVCCSVYFADRNVGFRGSEGVMLFSSTPASTALVFAHQFACPYTNDNGTNMQLITGPKPNLETLYRQMYNARKVSVTVTAGGYRFISSVNDARGGVVALIASATKL